MKNFLLLISTFLVLVLCAQAQGSDTLWVKQIGEVKTVKFSPDGQYVYAATYNLPPMKLDALNGNILKQYNIFQYTSTEHYFALDISSDGKWLVGAEYGNNVYIIDTDSGNIVQTLKTTYLDNQSNKFNTVAISPDNKKIIAVNRYASNNKTENSILIWNVETNSLIKNIVKSTAMLVKISPDNKYFAIGYRDDKIDNLDVYDLNTLNLIKSFKAHTNIVTDLAFSPDGSLLASCGWDGYIKIWDMNTMGLKKSLKLDVDHIDNVEFIDNQRLLSSSVESSRSCVVLWNLVDTSITKRWTWIDGLDLSQYLGQKCAVPCSWGLVCLNLENYVGVETQIDNNIVITPNPFNQNLSFNINQNNSANIKIELFDNLSNSIAVIYNSFISITPLILNYNTETLPVGAYYCKITNDNSTTTYKLIKIR